MKLWDIILSLGIVMIWGFSYVFVKEGTTYFPPFTMTLLRFLLVVILLLPFYPKPPAPIWQIVKIGFVWSVFHVAGFFLAIDLGLDTSIAGIVDQLSVPFTILLGVLMLKESIDKRVVLGVVIAFIGVIILFGAPNSVEHPFALCTMIVSAFAGAVYNVMLKKIDYQHVLSLVTWLALVSLPMLLPFAFFLEADQWNKVSVAPLSAWGSVIYMAVCSSIIAHGTWYYLIRHNPISRVTPIMLLIPVVTIGAGIVFFNEEVTEELLLGAVMMIVGVGIVLIRRPKIVNTDIGL